MPALPRGDNPTEAGAAREVGVTVRPDGDTLERWPRPDGDTLTRRPGDRCSCETGCAAAAARDAEGEVDERGC